MLDSAVESPKDALNADCRRRHSGPWHLLRSALWPLASLRLTVMLFAFSILLVFFGTLAQVDESLHTVLEKYFRSFFVWIPYQLIVLFGQKFLEDWVPSSAHVSGTFPFPGGWLLGGLLLVNLIAAHLVRFRISWKRSGILILHAGLIVLMVSELVAGLFAIESKMTIAQGETISFVDITHLPLLRNGADKFELAITTAGDANTDNVAVVPGSRLRKGGVISDPLLPVDIEVIEFMKNSNLVQARPEDQDAVTGPGGTRYTVTSQSEESGVSNDRDDAAAARIRVLRKGATEELATFLVSLWFYPNYMHRTMPFASQQFKLDDKTYTVELRYKRDYKPFNLELVEFRHDKYMGTDTPKNFSSRVRLTDRERGEDRESLIYMNHPLRHSGLAFYQTGYFPNNDGTILQVVENPGWLIPYISCAMVAAGMLVHFLICLVGFLSRIPRSKFGDTNAFERLFPGIIVAAAGLILVLAAWQSSTPKDAMNLAEFAKTPVVDRGRVKPIDTFARVNLRILSGRETFKDENNKTQPAIKWLLDVFVSEAFKREAARKHKVFRIENDQVLDLLDLPARPGSYRYSLDEIGPRFDRLLKEAQRANKVEANQRNVYDSKLLELANHLELYIALTRLELRMIPPQVPGAEWQPLIVGLQEALSKGDKSHGGTHLVELLVAYLRDKPDEFNQAVAAHHAQIAELVPGTLGTTEYETFFNHFDPFFWCKWLYVGVFTFACLSWLVFRNMFNRTAFWLTILTLSIHSYALISRMWIHGRPPVTSLYSSAIFIGWAGILLALFLEWIYRNGLGTAAAGVIGFSTMQIASFLAENGGDTLEMLQAVLDTNFWLSTHVTTITFGYAATFIAGIIAAAFLLLGAATPTLNRDLAKTLTQMTYGVVCFATFLSFVGTVLGGIWGDQSWGRFWGWDPKENGALILVLWNALILHARWAGLIKQRGLAVLAIVGNVVTAWSWFGTNQLSVGLHTYGFSKELAEGLRIFWGSQLALIILGVLPMRWWLSRDRIHQPANKGTETTGNGVPATS